MSSGSPHLSFFQALKIYAGLTPNFITHSYIMKSTLVILLTFVSCIFCATLKPKREAALFREELVEHLSKSPSTIIHKESKVNDYKGPGFYQYLHVLQPENFQWGFNRGNPSHFRGQFLERIGSTFKSAVSFFHFRKLVTKPLT